MDILRKYCPVLNAFLNGNNDLQLIAIYAMQVYWYSIDFPKGLLPLNSPSKFSKIYTFIFYPIFSQESCCDGSASSMS